MRLVTTVSTLLLACLLSACSVARSPVSPSLALVSSLPQAGGGSSPSSEISSQVVMVHFLASWCGLCAYELPHITAMRQSFDRSRVGVVIVATDDTMEALQAFIAPMNLPFPVVLDDRGDAKRLFAVSDLPTTLFMTADGDPVFLRDARTNARTNTFVGAYEWDRGPALQALEAAVAESSDKPPS